jgi:hypothetical protein
VSHRTPTWTDCATCKGQGVVMGGDEYRTCPACLLRNLDIRADQAIAHSTPSREYRHSPDSRCSFCTVSLRQGLGILAEVELRHEARKAGMSISDYAMDRALRSLRDEA